MSIGNGQLNSTKPETVAKTLDAMHDAQMVCIGKEAYNIGEAGQGSLNIGTDNAAPAVRADTHPSAVTVLDMTHADEAIREVKGGAAPTLQARMGTGGNQVPLVRVEPTVCKTLSAEGFDGMPDMHKGNGMPVVAIAGNKLCKNERAGCDNKHHSVAVYNIQTNDGGSHRRRDRPNGGMYITEAGASTTLNAVAPRETLAVGINSPQPHSTTRGFGDDVQPTFGAAAGESGNNKPMVALDHIVRRLTPVECERLQGFPDGWTRIPYRGKPAEECPDGPRYKAIGNSWGTNCAEWILRRILAARPVWHPESDEPSTTERIP